MAQMSFDDDAIKSDGIGGIECAAIKSGGAVEGGQFKAENMKFTVETSDTVAQDNTIYFSAEQQAFCIKDASGNVFTIDTTPV